MPRCNGEHPAARRPGRRRGRAACAPCAAAAEAQGPVLMHCKHGRDRTGLMAAMCTVVQGWSRADALAEMKAGGFGDARLMDDAIAYVEGADIDGLRQALASGACSTRTLAACQVGRWLRATFGAQADEEVAVSGPVEEVRSDS